MVRSVRTGAAPRRCCCLNTCTPSPAIAARQWSILLAQYEKAGLVLNCRELPDHLPLYLEYLSILPENEAREGLQNVAPILALLGGRLKQREVAWYPLFDALLSLAGSTLSSDSVTQQVNNESRDDTRQALDAVWEEEQVKFIEDNATTCDSSPLQQYQRRFSQGRGAAVRRRQRGRPEMIQYLNVFFTTSTPTSARRSFFSAAGCAMTTVSTPGAPPPARCSINAGW